jgi:hypothetical protein
MVSTKIASRAAAVAVACVVLIPLSGLAPASASSGATGIYKNCTKFNHQYPHGVGKKHAHDHHTKTSKGLDRDKDGIACEKH